MCSIGGFVSAKPLAASEARALCTALLHYGSIRGDQSSGVFANGEIFKRAEAPALLTNLAGYDDVFSGPTSIALTHTRMPTSGGRGDTDAQPFRRGDTISVHNGFFDTDIQKKWKINKKHSLVDSELITSFIASYGPRLLHRFIESTHGPSAVATIHGGKLYIISSGNPIYYAKFSVRGNSIFAFASTADILESSLKSVWLMPVYMRSLALTPDRLYMADASGLRRLSKPIKREIAFLSGYRGQWSHGGKSYDPKDWPDKDDARGNVRVVHNYKEFKDRLTGMGVNPESGELDGGDY